MTKQEATTLHLSKTELDKLILGRRSLYPRHFSGEKIDDAIVMQLLQYANTAPNHKRTRPWRFKVFTGKALFDLIDFMKSYSLSASKDGQMNPSKIASFEERKSKVSHIICIVKWKDEKARLPEMEEVAAVACAVENIYLSLNTFGLCGYWGTGEITFGREIRDFLKLRPDEEFMGFFYLGKPAVDAPPPLTREPVDDLVTWNR